MASELNNFEDLFRSTSEAKLETPSPAVLKKLKFRLMVDDFFSLRPGKFNIAYAGLLLAGITALLMLGGGQDELAQTAQTEDLVPEEKTIQRKATPTPQNADNSEATLAEAVPAPEANFTANTFEGCAPLEVQFTNASSNASEYYWEFEDGKRSKSDTPAITFDESGEYSVTLVAKNIQGTEDRITKKVIVKPSPQADLGIDIAASDVASRKVVFQNKSKGADRYTWSFGDNKKASGEKVQHTYNDYNEYEVQLIAENDAGCADTATYANKFVAKNYSLSFPDTFKPNPSGSSNKGYYDEAGTSSVFYPANNGVQEYELKILTPSGLEVFTTDNINQGWNGFIRGRMAPAGTYLYKASGVYPNGQAFTIRGKFRVLVEDYYMN